MSLLRRIEKSVDHRLRSIFSGGREEPGAREAIELYRDALDQIAGRATVGKRGDHVFPFNVITIELMAPDSERKAILETLFEPNQLIEDIRATLKEERVTAPEDLALSVHYPENAVTELRVLCEKAVTEAPAPAAPRSFAITPAYLITVTGASSSPGYRLDQPRVNLGREQDVPDTLGRTIRRNDLFFPEDAHEANASVSRSHAHIGFDSSSGEWRIYDDGSSIGTSVFRGGRLIEVPAHANRGMALRKGDEIYLGQVRLRFEA